MNYRIDKLDTKFVLEKGLILIPIGYGEFIEQYDLLNVAPDLISLEESMKKLKIGKNGNYITFSKKVSFTEILDLTINLKLDLNKIHLEGLEQKTL